MKLPKYLLQKTHKLLTYRRPTFMKKVRWYAYIFSNTETKSSNFSVMEHLISIIILQLFSL